MTTREEEEAIEAVEGVYISMSGYATSACFDACLKLPLSDSLPAKEKKCLMKCMDRYVEASQIVTETIAKELQRYEADEVAEIVQAMSVIK